MATLLAPDSEAHLGASLNCSKPLLASLSKNILVSEAMKGDTGKQDAAQHLLGHSLELLKPPSVEEKQGSGANPSQEEHANTPLYVPEMQEIKSTTRIDSLLKKHGPFSVSTLEPSESEKAGESKALELGAPNLAERKEESKVASTEHLLLRPEALINKKFWATSSSPDSTAPFESVKEAVSLLEERMDLKLETQVLEQKRVAPGLDILKASEVILLCKERLAAEEASIVDVLCELEKTKDQIRLCKGELPVTHVGEGSSSLPNQPEEVSNVSMAKGSHTDVLREVQLAEEEVDNVLGRRAQLETLKQSALREYEAAMTAKDNASTMVKELVKEHGSIQGSLTVLKAALSETEADITFLRSNPKIKLESLAESVTEADTPMEMLISELSTIRGVQLGKSDCELLGAKERLDQAKIVEGNHVVELGRVLEQLDEMKLSLTKAIDDGASLANTVGALQTEISKSQAELESAHETEQIACATLASLQDELCSVRAKVLSAQAGETKAREAKRSLPAAIKQLALDSDEAKAASHVAREEARKGRLEIDQTKAALTTTLSRLQAAQKEAEAVRASEVVALAELKALSEPEGELGEKIAISISFKEYCTLHDAGHQAEEAANKKVAAIFVQVDAATGSQQEAQGKLDATLKELDVLLKALEEAQKKADDAQAAKLSVEAELRKWRAEHEQWRKTGSNPSSVSTSAAQSPRFANGKSSHGKLVSQSFHGKPAIGLDSLAEVLTLKVPSAEKAAKVMTEMEFPKKAGKAKKLSFFARMMSIIVRKKSKAVM